MLASICKEADEVYNEIKNVNNLPKWDRKHSLEKTDNKVILKIFEKNISLYNNQQIINVRLKGNKLQLHDADYFKLCIKINIFVKKNILGCFSK